MRILENMYDSVKSTRDHIYLNDMLCNDCSQSTHVCDISRLGLRLMQHKYLDYLTGDWGVHVGSDIGMFTF